MKKAVMEYLMLMAIMFIINTIWQGLELLTIGKLEPSLADTVIAVILTISIYTNIHLYPRTKSGIKIVVTKREE
jgi:hypothetical protein